MQGNFGTFVLIFCKYSQLSIGRSSFHDDGAAIPHLLGAAERLGIRRNQVEDPVEHVADADAAGARHEGALHAVALGPPFILDRNRPVDDIEPGIVLGMAVQEADQGPIERRDRHRIVEAGAAIRRAQLQGRIFERGPDRPPQMTGVRHRAGAHHGVDIGVVFRGGAEQFRQAGARQLVIGGETIALQSGGVALPERRRGGERDKQRQIRQHARHHVDPARRIGELDMDMHAAQHVALADHLQIVHHLGVTVFRAFAPTRARTPADACRRPGSQARARRRRPPRLAAAGAVRCRASSARNAARSPPRFGPAKTRGRYAHWRRNRRHETARPASSPATSPVSASDRKYSSSMPK